MYEFDISIHIDSRGNTNNAGCYDNGYTNGGRYNCDAGYTHTNRAIYELQC
jgi:hypothetical protein